MASKRVLVVGAGPGGLAAGMLLAHHGFEVRVFEKNEEVGGRSGAIRKDGYTFDIGSTLLMMDFVLDELFERAGRRSGDYLSRLRLEPSYRVERGDERLEVSSDPERMRRTIARAYPGSQDGYARFLARERERFARLYPCLRGDFSRLRSLLRPETLRALPQMGLGRSLFATASSDFDPELLRLAFSFQSAYLGMSPWDCPAGFAMIPYAEHAYGVHHVRGGLNRVCHAMRRAIEEDGGQLHTETPVRRVVVASGRATGIELADGTRVEGDELIVNADFAYAAHQLFDDGVLGRTARPRLRAMRHSCSTFMLYLGLDRVYETPHHRVLFSHDYRSEMRSIFERGDVSGDVSLYVCNPSVSDPTMAPPGHSALYVLVLVPNLKVGTVDWGRAEGPLRDRVLDLLEAEPGGLPGLRRHIRTEVRCAPPDWTDRFNASHGAAFSFSHVWSQLLWLRPHARIARLENAYLAGGGTSPGSGLPTILESGRIASDLICARHGIPVAPLRGAPRPARWSAPATLPTEEEAA